MTLEALAKGLSDNMRAMIRSARPKRLIGGVEADFAVYGRGVTKLGLYRRGLATPVILTPLGLALRAHLLAKKKHTPS